MKWSVTAAAAISVIDRFLMATAITACVCAQPSLHICVSGSFSSDYLTTANSTPVENVTAAIILRILVRTLSALIARNSDMSVRHALMKNCVVYAKSLRIVRVSALTLGTDSLHPPHPLLRNKSNKSRYATKNRPAKNRGKNLHPQKYPPPVLSPPSPDDSDILDSQGLVILRSLFGSDDSLDAFSIPPDDPPDNSTPAEDDTNAGADDDDDMSSDDDNDNDDGSEEGSEDGDDVNDDDDDDDDDDDYDDAVAEKEAADHTEESQPLFSSTEPEPTAEPTVPPDPPIQQEQSGFGPMRSGRRSSRRHPAPMPEPLLALHRRATHPTPVPSGRAARDLSAVSADSLSAPPSTSSDHGNDPGPVT